MAGRVIANRKNVSITVHATANTTWQMSDFTGVGETNVTAVAIKQVWFGSPQSIANTYWTISRGANTVAILDSTGYMDYAGNGNMLNLDSTANVTVTLNGSTVGYIMLELQKLHQQYDYVNP